MLSSNLGIVGRLKALIVQHSHQEKGRDSESQEGVSGENSEKRWFDWSKPMQYVKVQTYQHPVYRPEVVLGMFSYFYQLLPENYH